MRTVDRKRLQHAMAQLGQALSESNAVFASRSLAARQRGFRNALSFELTASLPLGRTWKQRAADNILAIQVLRRVEEEKRRPTKVEQWQLIRYVGFGASELANAFLGEAGESDRTTGPLVNNKLRQLLTAEQYAIATSCLPYAHYTPIWVIRAIWAALIGGGFSGGRVLEPSVGTGRFIAVMPRSLRPRSRFTGIEVDPVPAGIATLLYPYDDIRTADFLKITLPKLYDLVVGNPPVSERRAEYSAGDRSKLDLHEEFILKSIESLRPGGIAALVTSQNVMDSSNDAARVRIASAAHLIGAVRLPKGIFRTSGGSKVIADVLFFQRRRHQEDYRGQSWEALSEMRPPHHRRAINRYFADHPEMILTANRS